MVITLRGLVKLRPYAILVAALAFDGCGGKPARVEGLGVPAPNPNGCYALLYQQSDWQGQRAVLNGPWKWANLERVQVDQVDWRNRIRSMDVGPMATVTVYAGPNFTGASHRLVPGSKPARLETLLDGGIESIEMSCPAGN